MEDRRHRVANKRLPEQSAGWTLFYNSAQFCQKGSHIGKIRLCFETFLRESVTSGNKNAHAPK